MTSRSHPYSPIRHFPDRLLHSLLVAYHISCYVERMAQAISVRLDDEALRALSELEATGMTRSEAIRAAIVQAASRLHDKQALAAEVAALEANNDDRAEMLAVAELMESLRAPG